MSSPNLSCSGLRRSAATASRNSLTKAGSHASSSQKTSSMRRNIKDFISTLSLADCPKCEIRVERHESNSKDNSGRVYFKCPKNANKHSCCKLFFWEEDCKECLVDHGFVNCVPNNSEDDELESDADLKCELANVLAEVKQNNEHACETRKHMKEDRKDKEMKEEIRKMASVVKMVAMFSSFVLAVVLGLLIVIVAKK